MSDFRCDVLPQNKEKADEVKDILPDFDDIMELSDFFKVMGDSTRLQILIVLIHKELCVSDISYILNMSQSAISHQLKQLRINKLVKSRREGRTIYYSLDDEHIENILSMSLEHIDEEN